MPARVPPETVKRFDKLLADGYNVALAARTCSVSKDWAYNRSKGRRKRDQAKFYADLDDANLPDPVVLDHLCEEARHALECFACFRLRYTGRRSMPWQIKAAQEAVEALASPIKEFVVTNMPPGAGKSTLFGHDLLLWLICRDRSVRILYGSNTERQAKMYTGRLRDSLERTTPYLATSKEKAQGSVDAVATVTGDYGRFKPLTPKAWRVEEFTVAQPNDTAASDKEHTVTAYGRDGGVLGGRYDFVIWDDLVDVKNQRTAESREALKAWWQSTAESRLEPGGVLILQGQRMGSDDLYRFALDMVDVDLDDEGFEVESAEPPLKYRHVIYKAHYDELCTGSHPRSTPAWPDGCLLDPHRLSWRDLKRVMNGGTGEAFLVQYQQEDTDPDNVLVRKLWISGGEDENRVEFPGCWDDDRGLCELPRGLKGDLFSYATVDPSPSKFWSVQWWIYHPESEQRFLMDLVRQQMPARGLLDYDIDERELVGLMPEWQDRSQRLGWPIRYWIVEAVAAQKWLAGYAAGDLFLSKYDAQIVRHQTNINKGDPQYGVTMLSTLYRQGRVRLPGKQSNGSRLASLKLVDEVTRWPKGATDDCVMAQWFGEWNLERLYSPAEIKPVRLHRVPSWSQDPVLVRAM